MSSAGRIPLNEVVTFDAITSSPFTGAATDADSTPTFAVYEDTTDTDIGVGGNMTKRTSLTGNYRASFTASAANGFEVGKWYNVICSATVGAVAGKCVSMTFMLTAAESAAGVPPVDVDTIKTNPVANGGTVTFPTNATLASTTGAVGSVTARVTANTDQWAGGTIPAPAVTGVPKVDLTYILGTILSETAGQLAAAFKKFFNIATPAATMDHGVLVDTVTTVTNQLSAATIAQAVWDALTSALTTVGSIGAWVVAKLDVVVSTRLASGSYTAPDNSSITAIKAKTDNLPASPAATSDCITAAGVRTAVGLASANLDTQLSEIATDVDDVAAIKSQTDKLAFTVPNQLDANIKSVKDEAVTGTGTDVDPWGP